MRILLAAVLLALGVAALGQVTAKDGRYLLRLKLTPGEQLHYKAPFTIEGLAGSEPIKLALKLDIRVLSVKGGKAKVRGKLDAGKFHGTEIMPSRTAEYEVDSRGRVSVQQTALGGFTVVFPQFPVKVGSSFVSPVPVLLSDTPDGEVGSRDATFTLVGFVGSGATRAAKLTFEVAGNQAPSGAMLVLVKDGTMYRYTTKFYLNAQAANPLKVTAFFERQ